MDFLCGRKNCPFPWQFLFHMENFMRELRFKIIHFETWRGYYLYLCLQNNNILWLLKATIPFMLTTVAIEPI